MLKYQIKAYHRMRQLCFWSMLFFATGYELYALDSLPDEDMAASFVMQPFDLEALMEQIIIEAKEKNSIDELPKSFIACYDALKNKDPMILSEHVLQILPFILTTLVPEMMERNINHS